MPNFLIAFLVGLGSGTWIYNKMYGKTGGNTSHALVVGGLSGFLLFLFMLIVLYIVGNMLSSAF